MPKLTPKLTPAPANRKPQVAPEPKLSEFQELVCETVGDLILRGGHEDEINKILDAAIGHYYRRMFPRSKMGDCPQQETDRVNKFIEDRYDDWHRKLAREWPAPAQVKDEPPLKGVVARVYATLRTDLQERLDDFMSEAGADDKYLLRDILMDWEGGKLPADYEDPEANLATAFMYRINDAHTYFKVPDKIKDLVESYIRLLLEAQEPKPQSAA